MDFWKRELFFQLRNNNKKIELSDCPFRERKTKSLVAEEIDQ